MLDRVQYTVESSHKTLDNLVGKGLISVSSGVWLISSRDSCEQVRLQRCYVGNVLPVAEPVRLKVVRVFETNKKL
jgi:hypothetical protein